MNNDVKSFAMNIFVTFFVITACLSFSSSVFAHYASVMVDNYNPAPGAEVTINIGWGHKFPGDGEMRREAYDKTILQLIDPQGKTETIPIIPEAEKGNKPIKVKLEKIGTYTILLLQKNFSTKTTDGYKYQPKNELKNVIHSSWSETVSKTIVTVSSAKKEFHCKETSDRFHLVPLEDPLTIEKGSFLPVKVTLDGKPWQGVVNATYDGFTDIADTFAYSTKTDKDGIAKIKMLEKSVWLIKADHLYPYEKKEEADEYSLKATLTLKN